jgi:FkbM family methyltransferase
MKVILRRLVKLVNIALRKVGVKIVSVGTPLRDFTEFFAHLELLNYRAKTVIDVGVGKGTPTLYKGNKSAKIILVEPVPDTNNILKDLADELDAEVHNVAASSSDGEITFNLHKDVTGSSLYDQSEGNDNFGVQKISVPQRRLETILTKPMERPILLKLDTQGHEIETLIGCGDLVNQIDMIIAEVSFQEFRDEAPEIADIMIEFNKFGFVPYEILEGHYRTVDNALAQVDLVFVKETSVLRAEKRFFSDEQLERYNTTGWLK